MLMSHRWTPIAQDTENGKWLILNMIFPSLEKKAGRHLFFYEQDGRQQCMAFNRRKLRWEPHELALSQSHIDILHLASRGYAEKEIADEMNKSVSTIKFHKKKICENMRVASIHEALCQCFSLNLML